MQDPLYQPNYYLDLKGFRDLTSSRMKKFVDQKFFSVSDYTKGERHLQKILCFRICVSAFGAIFQGLLNQTYVVKCGYQGLLPSSRSPQISSSFGVSCILWLFLGYQGWGAFYTLWRDCGQAGHWKAPQVICSAQWPMHSVIISLTKGLCIVASSDTSNVLKLCRRGNHYLNSSVARQHKACIFNAWTAFVGLHSFHSCSGHVVVYMQGDPSQDGYSGPARLLWHDRVRPWLECDGDWDYGNSWVMVPSHTCYESSCVAYAYQVFWVHQQNMIATSSWSCPQTYFDRVFAGCIWPILTGVCH